MSQVLDETLSSAKAAIERHDWREGFDLLSEIDKGELGPSDLDALAEAAWWTAHIPESLSARERSFAGYLKEGDKQHAAMSALLLARESFMKGDMAVGGGWLARAERLLEAEPESVAHGYLQLSKAEMALHSPDLAAATTMAEKASEIGARFADRDLQAFGLAIKGVAQVSEGRIKEGMALIDEATVAAVSGELGPYATGIIYCMTISTCRDLADYRRAGEWTEAAKRWCERQSISGFPGVCRVHRAEIMSLQGDWAGAEQEARRAADEILRYNLAPIAAFGFYEIGQIRMRMGDLPAAEEAFEQANQMGMSPQPGISLLRLWQGRADAAAISINNAVEQEANQLNRGRYLPVQVQIALAVGDIGTAKTATTELEAFAEVAGSPALHASAHFARASVLLAEGNFLEATRTARKGCQHWNEVNVPYEASRTRALIAAISRAAGDEDEAVREMRAAKTVFHKLGAAIDLRAADEFLGKDAKSVSESRERVTKVFMFTDIVESTALVEAIGDEAWQDMITWHDRALRLLLAEYAGEEIRHQGDGFVWAFADAKAAVGCAVAIQRKLVEHRRETGFAPQVRIGLHEAEATRRGLDYAGKGIHEAARIGALAKGGEIIASTCTISDLGSSSITLGDKRQVDLKGISEPIEVAPVLWR